MEGRRFPEKLIAIIRDGAKCHVQHRAKISEEFERGKAESVRILSSILFLLIIGSVLQPALSEGLGAIQQTITSFFKPERKASRVGLKIITNKTKVLNLMGQNTLLICINGQSIEDIVELVCLGNVISADGGSELDERIKSTRSAFAILSKIWRCNYLNTKVKTILR